MEMERERERERDRDRNRDRDNVRERVCGTNKCLVLWSQYCRVFANVLRLQIA